MSKIKICGIKNTDEARKVASLEINYIGVIFAKSIRQVDLKTANEIAKIAHENGKKVVGVFAKCDNVLEYMENLDVAQIYDTIPAELYKSLNSSKKEVWQVFSVFNELPNLAISEYDMALFDCKGESLGGNGISFEWEILKSLEPFSYGLAGGLGVHNVELAASYKPKVLDINSRVENANGIKDESLIKEIIKKVKK
ncbi:MAG: phosphoribosylanthranilate isomerase [Campylobacteraceae bacterium]|nr:phosphoribosylanthranilate isomerase [Campylobacteraceae bacterium]